MSKNHPVGDINQEKSSVQFCIVDFFVLEGKILRRIQSITVKEDYKLEALLDNGSSIILNLKSRLGTVRFGLLADPEFFHQATTNGHFIRWGDKVEISLSELFQLAQK
jgi:hypothetical protein